MNTVSDLAAVSGDLQGSTLLEIASFLSDGSPEEGFSLTELNAKAASELKRFGVDLQSHLGLIGVTIPPALQLRGDNVGALHVIGEHALKAEIEAFLNDNTRLLKWYKEIEVMYEILRRTELAPGQGLEGQVFNLGLTSLGCVAFFSVL
ncbi:hypothetical protein [Janthinobacterium sp. B9-8]|uniref:hypothetical protein n=1 Tax=Janthinobacterium sp. B9-8 TaxID=1236179 RepID=UPI00061CF6C8|nr:hypothetical protein [Janthinobacterium sp. B9-8]AMC34131.1 hypothetical protein VN23_05755 [Janthinobacterium sp. B9-8]